MYEYIFGWIEIEIERNREKGKTWLQEQSNNIK